MNNKNSKLIVFIVNQNFDCAMQENSSGLRYPLLVYLKKRGRAKEKNDKVESTLLSDDG